MAEPQNVPVEWLVDPSNSDRGIMRARVNDATLVITWDRRCVNQAESPADSCMRVLLDSARDMFERGLERYETENALFFGQVDIGAEAEKFLEGESGE